MKAYFLRVGVYLLVGMIGVAILLPTNLFAQRGKEVDYKLLRRDIEVMVGVINTMLKESWLDEERERIYYTSWRSVECQGFHLADYGIVFTLTLPVRFGIEIIQREVVDIRLRIEGLRSMREEREKVAEEKVEKKRSEVLEERLASFRDQLIDIMGNYGDFIKQVPPEGYITTVVFYGDSDLVRGITKRMILTIRRGDISQYRDGKLSMGEFKKRVKYVEY